MRFARAFPLASACLIGSASLLGTAYAQTDPYALDRLFLTSNDWVPLGEVLSFSSATAVANYFGASSNPANLATEFYDGYNSSDGPANMLFARFPYLPARAHLYGAYITDPKLANIQAIDGTLAITSQGYQYNGTVDLSGAKSFREAATEIRDALNKNLQVAAVTTGSSIAPVSVSYTGSISYGNLTVSSVSSGTIEIGSYISGAGIPSGAQITSQISGTPGGAGHYGLFVREGTVSTEAMTDSYGVLTVGSVSSGTGVGVGQQVTNGARGSGNNIAQHTAIEDYLGGGAGAGSMWVVDRAQTVTSENMTMTGAPISVAYRAVNGENGEKFGYFLIQQWPSFNFSTSTLTYATGTAAAPLFLADGSGAYLSSPGQVVVPVPGDTDTIDTDVSNWMNNLLELPGGDEWSTFQTTYDPQVATPPYEQSALGAWAKSTDGESTYLSGWSANTPPIVDSLSPSVASALALSPATAVPEPPIWVMALLGFAGLGLARKCRMRTRKMADGDKRGLYVCSNV